MYPQCVRAKLGLTRRQIHVVRDPSLWYLPAYTAQFLYGEAKAVPAASWGESQACHFVILYLNLYIACFHVFVSILPPRQPACRNQYPSVKRDLQYSQNPQLISCSCGFSSSDSPLVSRPLAMATPSSIFIRGRVRLPSSLEPKCLCPQPKTTSIRGPTHQFAAGPRASFHHSRRIFQNRDRFGSRLRHALNDTKIKWYPIPVGLGIGFLGFIQFYKTQARERERLEREASQEQEPRPTKRSRVRPDGPW